MTFKRELREMRACNDPTNAHPYAEHYEALDKHGRCPACGEAKTFTVKRGQFGSVLSAADGEIVAALIGPQYYILNYPAAIKAANEPEGVPVEF